MQAQGKSKPTPYRGTLTPKSASEGIHIVKTNATRLLDDAKILSKNGRYPSACALAAIAIEEQSKPAIIRKIVIAESPEEIAHAWKLFYSHLEKGAPWIVPHLMRGTSTYEDLVEEFMRNRDPILLDSLKQISIYSGCYGKSHWSSPSEVIEKDQAELLIYTAKILNLSGQISPLDSEEGIRLWKTHMKGCFSLGYVTANNKIVEFFSKAADQGLLIDNIIPKSVAFDFMTTVLILSDGEVEEQKRMFGIPFTGDN